MDLPARLTVRKSSVVQLEHVDTERVKDVQVHVCLNLAVSTTLQQIR